MNGTWDGGVDLDFGGEARRFRLRIRELVALQDATGTGPMEALDRLRSGRWKVADVRETIRLGLEGGGENPGKALSLVRRYVEDRPLTEGVGVAMLVLVAALFPPEGVPEGNADGGAGTTENVSTSPSSTEPAP